MASLATARSLTKQTHTMAMDQSALLNVLDAFKASASDDVARTALQVMLQALIEAEATSTIGAHPHERSDSRATQRNGHRSRGLNTAAGDVGLKIPKVRDLLVLSLVVGTAPPY